MCGFTNVLWDAGERVSKPMIILIALKAVDEIIEATGLEGWDDTVKFWRQVKKEIEKQ